MSDNDMTTLAVTQLTRNRLAGVCRKDQSYDEFINVLLDNFEKK